MISSHMIEVRTEYQEGDRGYLTGALRVSRGQFYDLVRQN